MQFGRQAAAPRFAGRQPCRGVSGEGAGPQNRASYARVVRRRALRHGPFFHGQALAGSASIPWGARDADRY
jgi:hypothetical protein